LREQSTEHVEGAAVVFSWICRWRRRGVSSATATKVVGVEDAMKATMQRVSVFISLPLLHEKIVFLEIVWNE
jgi:hypothetical protein